MSELKILFATDFSAPCAKTIGAVEELAGMLPVNITIAHAADARQEAGKELGSFFTEAGKYGGCRRIVLCGPPAEALATFTRDEHFDLVVAPGSDRLPIPRPFHRSLRGHLLRQGASPVWTSGRGLKQDSFRHPVRTVAVGLDGWDSDLRHLKLASAFADRTGAQLRLLTVVPEVSEGTLVGQAVIPQPLHPDAAIERIERLLSGWHRMPAIDVAIGSSGRELQRMAARCDAGLLFLSHSQSTGGLLGRQVSRTVNASPCPVVCVPSALSEEFRWSFERDSDMRRRDLLTAVPS